MKRFYTAALRLIGLQSSRAVLQLLFYYSNWRYASAILEREI
jgi:hypothetical protein